MKAIASTSTMLLRYSPKNQIPPVAARYLASPVHPIRPKIAHMYANRDKNTLWWRVNISQLQTFKRVVRSWCGRRARVAFHEALKHRGLDKQGRPLATAANDRVTGLTGSLELVLRPEFRDKPYESVQRDVHYLVESLFKKPTLFHGRPSSKHGARSAARGKS